MPTISAATAMANGMLGPQYQQQYQQPEQPHRNSSVSPRLEDVVITQQQRSTTGETQNWETTDRETTDVETTDGEITNVETTDWETTER